MFWYAMDGIVCSGVGEKVVAALGNPIKEVGPPHRQCQTALLFLKDTCARPRVRAWGARACPMACTRACACGYG